MAKSIKLSGDNYWDTSGLHGGQIFNSLGSITNGSTVNIAVPNAFRGILLLYNASTTNMGMYMVYSISSGNTYLCPINAIVNTVTVSSSANNITVKNQSGGSIFAFYIGNNELTL